MKNVAMFLMCLLAILVAGTSLKAQEVTITLNPGWNWISYPNAMAMDVSEAFGGFVPMAGDIVKSRLGSSTYINGQWRGGVSQFTPGWGYMYYSSRIETISFVFAQSTSSFVVTDIPTNITAASAVVGGTVTLAEGNHIFARGVCWGTEPNPNIDGSHTTDAAIAGSLSDTLTGLTPSTTYYVRAYAVTDYGLAYGEELSFTTEDGSGDHDYVDLGLPSGLLWATCNVGADSPEDYGDYFAWGETQPKDTYNWSTYQYANGTSWLDPQLTKYCSNSSYGYNGFTDNLTSLLPEDDAATANWGDGWRMPTKNEWEELYNNTTCTWTTQNGVNGRLFTALNGNSLFLPAAGYRNNSSLYNAGSYGYFWSRSLNTDSPNYAWNFYFNSDVCKMGNYDRRCGFTVRPVCSGSLNTSFIINVTINPEEGGVVSGGGTYQEGAECTLTAMPNEGYTFTYWTENGNIISINASYTFIVNTDRTLVANFTYNGSGDHDYVDLGLPSGTLWATCNVGADTPEDYGDYFAWGETQPKDYYDWSTYQYCNGTSLDDPQLTKYCSNSNDGYNGYTDNLTILLPEDDAATANWGDDWRMPTQEEWQELLDNTTVTWTTQNGVSGRLFTASNGNSLFLPAAGFRFDSSLLTAGSDGDYMSCSLHTYPVFEWGLGFGSAYYGEGYAERCYGRSVRPVRSGSPNNAPTGAIDGKFTINEDGGQVYFSQGNLQYQASTDTWLFAENQWDYVGEDNSNISQTYDGWIDLFGWGTSGYHNSSDPYNVNYQPWSTSTSQVNSSYNYWGYGPSTNMTAPNLTGISADYDWGVYNPISNGGNTANQWHTLSQPEWGYVFNTRTTTSGIRYAKANVNNVNGVILLPDDWSTSTYSLSNTNSSGASFSGNTLSASQWSTLEQAGAVFLPAAGRRNGTSVGNVGSDGRYWSTSNGGIGTAYGLYFSNSYLHPMDNGASRCYGISVRLVRPVEN